MTAARILVVDDEPDLRALLADYLEMQGFSVGAASNTAELDARLAEAPADVIVLDINMPARTVSRRWRGSAPAATGPG